MTMQQMVECLENRGFTAIKRYIGGSHSEYEFVIKKDGVFFVDQFAYPERADDKEKNYLQEYFIDKLIAGWETQCRISDNRKRATFNSSRYTPPTIKKVIFNPPATIVLWEDGTKTVVKAQDEDFDPEKGLAMAISKKALGNQGNYCNEIKKWVDKYEPVEEDDSITGLYNAQEFTFTLAPNSVCVSTLNNLTGDHSKKSINFVADVIGSEPEEPRSEALDE